MPANTPFPFWRVTGSALGRLTIQASNATAAGQQGMAFYCFAGDGPNTGGANQDSRGGYAYFEAGAGFATTGANSGSYGGNVAVRAGYGSASAQYYSRGGNAYVEAGVGGNSDYSSYGGNIFIRAGDPGTSATGYGYGGEINMYGGGGGDYGGDISLQAGGGAGGGGNISIYSGTPDGRVIIGSADDLYLQSDDTNARFVTSRRFHRIIPTRTVAQLPAAGGANTGCHATVSDSNAAITAGIGAVVAGGGANVVPVFSDGANWRIA